MRSLTRFFLVLFFVVPGALISAQQTTDKSTQPVSGGATKEEVDQLRQEITAQRQTIEQLKTMVQQLAATKSPDNTPDHARVVDAVLVPAQGAAADQKPAEKKESNAIQKITGPELKFSVGGGEVQVYGHADVSFDYVDNGLAN